MKKYTFFWIALVLIGAGCNPTTVPTEEGGGGLGLLFDAGPTTDDEGTEPGSFLDAGTSDEEEEEEEVVATAEGTCADPFPLGPEGAARAMVNRASALVGSCGGGGPEAVYLFELLEPSGVEIAVDGIDSVIYLLAQSCSTANEVSGTCRDREYAATPAEEIRAPLLEAGTYYLVVDSYMTTEAGNYSISWTVTPGGFCANDEYEPNQDENNAVDLGAYNIDTAAVEQADGEPPLEIDFELCEADVDFFAFGHMGGGISVTATLVDEAGTVEGEIFKAVRSGDGDTGYSFELGDSVGSLPYENELESGSYFLKMTGSSEDNTDGPNYTLAVVHDCEPDSYDNFEAEYDDNTYQRARVQLNNTLDEPVARRLCGDDADAFILSNVMEGTITFSVAGGAGFSALVQAVGEASETGDGDTDGGPDAGADADGGVEADADEGEGEGEEVALTAIDAEVTTEGDDLTVILPEASTGSYLVTLTAPEAASTTEYEINAIFAGIANGPSNETCDEAQTLLTDGTPVVGHTFNAVDDVDGPTIEEVNSLGETTMSSCNGEPEADEAVAAAEAEGEAHPGTPTDVFYYVNVAETSDFEINFDGTGGGFAGAIYMLDSGGFCPADLSTLPYVAGDSGSALCGTGEQQRVRINDLAAGDYLLVVDGIFREGYPLFDIPHTVSLGSFTLDAKTYPEGFPPIESCANAQTFEVPASGASTEIEIDHDDGFGWIDAYDDCEGTSGGRGLEQILILAPENDVTVDLTVTGDYDTVMEIREANEEAGAGYECEEGTPLACNDDGDGVAGLGSLLENVTLTGGKVYYLIVDAYGSYASGSVTLTVEAQ